MYVYIVCVCVCVRVVGGAEGKEVVCVWKEEISSVSVTGTCNLWPHNMLLGGVPAHHRVGRLGRATNTLNLHRTCNVVNVSTELP